MNENEITRIVADAIREAYEINTAQFKDEKIERETIDAVLFDVAYNLAKEIWPTSSPEAPSMPDEWAEAIKGR